MNCSGSHLVSPALRPTTTSSYQSLPARLARPITSSTPMGPVLSAFSSSVSWMVENLAISLSMPSWKRYMMYCTGDFSK